MSSSSNTFPVILPIATLATLSAVTASVLTVFYVTRRPPAVGAAQCRQSGLSSTGNANVQPELSTNCAGKICLGAHQPEISARRLETTQNVGDKGGSKESDITLGLHTKNGQNSHGNAQSVLAHLGDNHFHRVHQYNVFDVLTAKPASVDGIYSRFSVAKREKRRKVPKQCDLANRSSYNCKPDIISKAKTNSTQLASMTSNSIASPSSSLPHTVPSTLEKLCDDALMLRDVSIHRHIAMGEGLLDGSSPSERLGWVIFWDIENIAIPHGMPVSQFVRGLRNYVASLRNEKMMDPVLRITAVANINRMSGYMKAQLHSNGVTVVHVQTNTRKDVSDKALLTDLCLLPFHMPPPLGVALLSGDVDFSYAVARLTALAYHTVVITPENSSSSLLAAAPTSVVSLPQVLKNAPPLASASIAPSSIVGGQPRRRWRHNGYRQPPSSSRTPRLASKTNHNQAIPAIEGPDNNTNAGHRRAPQGLPLVSSSGGKSHEVRPVLHSSSTSRHNSVPLSATVSRKDSNRWKLVRSKRRLAHFIFASIVCIFVTIVFILRVMERLSAKFFSDTCII